MCSGNLQKYIFSKALMDILRSKFNYYVFNTIVNGKRNLPRSAAVA